MSHPAAIFVLFCVPWVAFALTALLAGRVENGALLFLALRFALDQPHIALVFARSHLNRDIYRRYPVRFVIVPMLLVGVMILSDWALFVGILIIPVWDLYHAGAQVFGIGRMLDRRPGERGADLVFCATFFAAAVLTSPAFPEHVRYFVSRQALCPARLRWAIDVGLGALAVARPCFLVTLGTTVAWYIARQMARRGAPPEKWALYATTGAVVFASWNFLPFPFCTLPLVVTHSTQYFLVVWLAERVRLAGARFAAVIAGTAAFALAYGLLGDIRLVACAGVTASLLHFWYDGFIWSVRRGEV